MIVGASILFTYLVVPIPVYNTIWILLIAYVTLYLPYGMRFASSGITQIHRELEEVAEVSGARLGQTFLRVLLPLILPVLLAAWIYVFVLSVRELGASIFLVGPGHQRARHHQPDHVGGGRQLRRGLRARRAANPAAACHRRRLALAGAAGAAARADG